LLQDGLGFFSSTAINILSDGFATFIYNGGKMRLIINNILSDNDKEAVLLGLKNNELKAFDLYDLIGLKTTLSTHDKHFFECIAWLIANKRIDIKIISPKGTIGISHTKSGAFSDGQDMVAFNGSCNFSKTALIDNIESIDAFCGWDDEVNQAKVKNTSTIFERTFSGDDDTVQYLDAEDIISNITTQFGNKSIEELLDQERRIVTEKIDNELRPTIKKVLEKAKKHIETTYNTIVEEQQKPHFPYKEGPRDYQKLAFDNWRKNNQQGLFAMATGTGKTITSLNCLLEIYNKNGYYKALILVPTITLLNQWEKECRKFNFNIIIKVFSKNSNWRKDLDDIRLIERINGKDNKISYVIISTYASFVKDKIFKELNSFPRNKLLLIADEVHNMGSGQIRNRLSSIKYVRRIGLSATPERQYDEIGNKELFSFFGVEDKYTYEYSMEEAINKGVLCRYYYYPHLVKLTVEEMKDYSELSLKIVKYYSNSKDTLTTNDPILTALLLKRKQIIHKAANKLNVFKEILIKRMAVNGSLKYTLIYVPEGNQPDNEADLFHDREELDNDQIASNLINQYTQIVSDIDSKVTVKQFTATSTSRDQILEDFANGNLDVLTSMKCLDEGVDVPRSELAIFCASTGNPRQFIQRRGRILRTHKDKHIAEIHDLVVAPEMNPNSDSFNLERNLLKSELRRVNNFSLLSENSSDTFVELENILKYYNLSLFNN